MIYDCSSSQSCDSASCSYFHTQHFLQPPIFPKNLTNLTDLTDFTILQTPYRQCAGTFRTSYNRATRTGPRYFFVHLAQVAASLRSAGAGNRAAGGRESFMAAGWPRTRTRVSWRVSRRPAGRLESFVAAGFAGNLAVFDLEGLGWRAGGWKSESVSHRRVSGRRPRAHAGMQKSCIFPAFLPEKFAIGKLKKSGENPLAHSAASPDQFYGMEPCEMAREKWGAASPRSCVPLSQMLQ